MKYFRDSGFSARVELFLKIGNDLWGAAQTGSDFIILDEPRHIPPATDAELIVMVDGHSDSRPIFLHQGADGVSTRVAYF